MTIEITPEELKTVARVADYIHFRHPNVLETDELRSAITLWMLEHPDAVRRIRFQENRGLYTALRRAGMRAVQQERAYQRGYDPADQFKYPAGLLFELLKQALPLDRDLSEESGTKAQVPTGTKVDPAFGGERLAMLVDVRLAISRLSPMMAQRLHEAVAEQFDYKELALMWSTEEKPVSAEAAKKRVKRAVQALSDLMSEPRAEQEAKEYIGARTAVSNARARSAIAIGAPAPTVGRSPWLEGGVLS